MSLNMPIKNFLNLGNHLKMWQMNSLKKLRIIMFKTFVTLYSKQNVGFHMRGKMYDS